MHWPSSHPGNGISKHTRNAPSSPSRVLVYRPRPPSFPPRRQTTTVTYLPSSRPWHAVNVALHFLFPSSRLRRLRKYRGLRAFRSTIGSVEFLVARMHIHVYIVFLLIEIRPIVEYFCNSILCTIILTSIRLALHFNTSYIFWTQLQNVRVGDLYNLLARVKFDRHTEKNRLIVPTRRIW